MSVRKNPNFLTNIDGVWKSLDSQYVPPPFSGPTPDWGDEFTSLNLTTDTHIGIWRPNDFWQNINRGYEDFAGTSWNANPNELSVNINPFSVSDSVLTITCDKTPIEANAAIAASMSAQGQSGGVPAWTGGILITDPSVEPFLYGYFEFRVRFPQVGKGMFPAIWLYHAPGNETKTSAEIDIFEVFGYATGQPFTTSYHGNSSGEIGTQNIDLTQWHVYGFDWQPTYLKFYLDNTFKYELTGSEASWFDVPMQIRLNYSMDAPWFSSNLSDGSTPYPLTMLIDYVRYWTENPYN